MEFTRADRAAAVEAMRTALAARYVYPDRVPAMTARLDEALAAGRYDVREPSTFAELVTADLAETGADQHLWLRWDPAAHAAAAAVAEDSTDDEWEELNRRRTRRDHHGLVAQRILDGNVRYLRISEFWWVPDESGHAYDAAMRFLSDGDAIIIDLRGCPGGDAAAVNYVLSHFLPRETLDTTFLAAGQEPQQARALSHLPAGRLTGRPLYVLIDGSVGSAGESFAYSVRAHGVGELVGHVTIGAANNNELHPIPPQFVLSVSYGHPVHAVTGTNWEGTGVEPTVPAPAATALETAHAHALHRLSATATDDEDRDRYAWASLAATARLTPPAVELAGYAGTFGAVSVAHTDGALWLQRARREATRLWALTSDGWFGLDGTDAIRAHITGDRVELWTLDSPGCRVFPRDRSDRQPARDHRP